MAGGSLDGRRDDTTSDEANAGSVATGIMRLSGGQTGFFVFFFLFLFFFFVLIPQPKKQRLCEAGVVCLFCSIYFVTYVRYHHL